MHIRTQTERNKTDISGRNTLPQLHWLYHSVNTQYRQDLIANTWWVWIYKNQTKSLQLPPPLICICVHWMMGLCLRFLSVHSLTLWKISEDSKATYTTNLLQQHLPRHSCWHYTELLRSVCSIKMEIPCQVFQCHQSSSDLWECEFFLGCWNLFFHAWTNIILWMVG